MLQELELYQSQKVSAFSEEIKVTYLGFAPNAWDYTLLHSGEDDRKFDLGEKDDFYKKIFLFKEICVSQYMTTCYMNFH